MMTLNKKTIIDGIATKHELKQKDVRLVLQSFLDLIVSELESGNRIEIRNFGVFEVKRHASKMGRNPRTGEAVTVPARNVVKFRPGKEVKEKMNSV